MIRLILAVSLLFAIPALAADPGSRASAEDRARNDEIAQKAKQKAYPGGRDESDLRVQNPLPQPVRKMTPSADEDKPDDD